MNDLVCMLYMMRCPSFFLLLKWVLDSVLIDLVVSYIDVIQCNFCSFTEISNNFRWTPYGNTKCTICKQQVHQDAKYCHTCAYSKGKN